MTTPRTTEYERYTLEPVFDIGGPAIKNRAWFFFGYNPSVTNQDRTVQWSNPVVGGVTYPAIQTFNDKDTDTRYLYNGTVQISQNLRGRVNGNNQRVSERARTADDHRDEFHPSTTTATRWPSARNNAANFNPQLDTFTATTSTIRTAGRWTGSSNNKTYANFTGGYLGGAEQGYGRRLLPRHPPHVQQLEHRLARRAGESSVHDAVLRQSGRTRSGSRTTTAATTSRAT